jgi:hypothetical protein
MNNTGYQKEKERSIQSALGEQLRKHSLEIMDEITYEIALSAKKLTTNFLGDVFRNIFSIERSCEYSYPVVFQLGESTDLILYERLNPLQLKHLPFYIMNEEVLAKSFHPMREMNFVVFIDLSLSMLYRWPLIKMAAMDKYVSGNRIREIKETSRKTKLYALKYLSYAFIDSALQNGFKTNIVFFSNRTGHQISSTRDRKLPSFVLHHIDEYFLKTYARALSSDRYSENGGYLDVLMNFLGKKKKCIVLFLSDFLDGIEEIKPYLIELNYKSPLIVGVINDPYEIEFPSRKFIDPVTVTHEHCKNMERDLEGEVRLSSSLIKKYNAKSRRRRKDIFDFLGERRITHMDIQTQDNDKIPLKLQELNTDLLGEL